MNHHTAPALEDLASEFGVIVDDMFIPAGDMGLCNCEAAMAEFDGLCSPCYADRQEWLEFNYSDPYEFMDQYEETREWVDF
jgi:hypothetical protein